MKISQSVRRPIIQLTGMLLAIFFVILIFKIIEPVKLAALIAGFIFLFVSLGILYSENRWGRANRSLAFWTAFLFLVFFVIPIFGLRIMYWDQDFNDLSFFGIPATSLHHLSSRCYLLMVGMVIYEGLRPYLPGRKIEKRSS